MLHNRYLIVVAASAWYWPGLTTLLNSFWHYHEGEDIGVYLLDYDLEEYRKDVVWPFDIEIIPLEDDGRTRSVTCMLDRFLFASQLNRVVMLVDADYFFLGSMKPYFDMASNGYIVGACNGRHALFSSRDIKWSNEHKEWDKKWIDIMFMTDPPVGMEDLAGRYNHKTIGLPLIMDMGKYGYVCKYVWDRWHIQYRDKVKITKEWILLNAYLLHYELLDYIVPIPPQQVSNLQNMMLKIGLKEYRDKLFTRDGLEVLMVHDKWWSNRFVKNLKEIGAKYYAGDEARITEWIAGVDLIEKKFRRFKC